MFFPNLPAALGRIRQLLTLNSRISAAVWSAASKVPLIDLAFNTVRKQINAPAPPPGALGPFALADLEGLKGSFRQAEFKDLKTKTFQITFEFDSPESYTSLHQQTATRIHACLQTITMMCRSACGMPSPKKSGSMLVLMAE